MRILDVVGVVGVVGISDCHHSVATRVTEAKTPLLKELMDAARFVFIQMDYAAQPSRSPISAGAGSLLARASSHSVEKPVQKPVHAYY